MLGSTTGRNSTSSLSTTFWSIARCTRITRLGSDRVYVPLHERYATTRFTRGSRATRLTTMYWVH